MPRPDQIPLQQDFIIAKRLDCLPLGRQDLVFERRHVVHDAHAFAAASVSGLDEDRQSDRVGGGEESGEVLGCAVVASAVSVGSR